MKTKIMRVHASYVAVKRLFMRVSKHLWPLLILMFPPSVFGEEDVLRVLIWEGYAPKRYVEDFEREIEVKYGRKVKMEISHAESPDDFYNAVRDKSVDLVTISHHTIKDERFHYIAKKLILPFDLKNIPNHSNVIPDLKEAGYHVSNGKVYGVPIANGPYGLAYNTKVFKQAPESWKIFWDPAYMPSGFMNIFTMLTLPRCRWDIRGIPSTVMTH